LSPLNPPKWDLLALPKTSIFLNLFQVFPSDIDNPSNPEVKLQAVAIANNCYKFILDMSTNAGIVSDALKYVTQKTEQLTTQQHKIGDTEAEETMSGLE
jgi:hypothetical protein